MSGDPMVSQALAAALAEHGMSRSESGADGTPPDITMAWLCRLVGEERFFRAAFSRVRAGRKPGNAREPGDTGRVPSDAGGCDGGAGPGTWVLELDFEEVLLDALDGEPGGRAAPPRAGGGSR